MTGKPLFLGRKGYRARRLRDAARLLPLLGLALLLLPVMWAPSLRALIGDAMYIFAVWLGLIVAAGLLGRCLTRDDGGDDAL
jgi:hypothetical protein